MRVPGSLALTVALVAASCGTPSSTGPASDAVRPIENPAPEGSLEPNLVAGEGRIVLSWIEPARSGATPSLRYAEWRSGAWTEARTAVADPALLVNPGEIPWVVPLAGGGLAAAWVAHRPGGEYATEIRASVSRDGGLSWAAPRTVNADGTPTPHGLTSVAAAPDGGFELAWLDGRAESDPASAAATALYASGWGEAGLRQEERVDERVCDCCKTSLAAIPGGFIVAYRDRTEDDVRDIAVSRRTRSGWGAATPLPPDGWRLSACPTNGPAVAVRDSRAAVAWFTGAGGGRVRLAFSPDDGATFGPPASVEIDRPMGRVDLALLRDGQAAVVWLERRSAGTAELVARRVSADGRAAPPVVVARTTAGHASGFPRVAAAPDGGVLVAWTDASPVPRVRTAAVRL